jgi:membrane protein DedA with SNARE-associated domain
MDSEIPSVISSDSQNKKRIFKGSDFILLLLLVIIGVVHYFAWRFPDFGNNFSMQNLFGGEYTNAPFWIATGLTMVACFLGALVPMPIPYMIPVSTLSFAWASDFPHKWFWIIGLVILSAFANAVGDSLDYIIGRGTEMVIEKDDPELTSKWAKIVLYYPKAIPWLIILFAATPLPDSVLLVPLGLVKYPPKRGFIYMMIGKIVMMGVSSIAGIFGIEVILNLVSGEGSWQSGIIMLYVLWVIIVLMVIVPRFIPEKKALKSTKPIDIPK